MTLEAIKEQLRKLLIEHDGNIAPYQLAEIIEAARKTGIEEYHIARLLPEADRAINWVAVREEKKIKEEARIQREEDLLHASDLVNKMIDDCFSKEFVPQDEIKKIFDSAAGLQLSDHKVARRINEKIKKGNYKSHPEISTQNRRVKDILLSASWYIPVQLETEPEHEVVYEFDSGAVTHAAAKPVKKFSSRTLFIITTTIFAVYLLFVITTHYIDPKENTDKTDTTSAQHQLLTNALELSPREREHITNALIDFYREDNGDGSPGNLSRLMLFFTDTVKRYYRYTNISKPAIRKIVDDYINRKLSAHKSEVRQFYFMEKTPDNEYKIRAEGTYSYILTSKKHIRTTTSINDIIILDNQYRISSIYKE